MRRRRRAAAAVAAAAAVLALPLAGCGGEDRRHSPAPSAGTAESGDAARGTRARNPEAAATPRTPSDVDGVVGLLARRDRALRVGDATALAATSAGAQRREDRREAVRARALPLRRVASAATAVELDGRRATLRVRTEYRFAGVRGRFALDRRVRATRTREGWRISRDGAGRRGRAPWEVAAFTPRRARHFLVLAPAGLATPGLGTALEAARRGLERTLPAARPPDRLLVVVATGIDQAAALTSSIRGVEGLTAVSDAAVRESGPERRVVAVESQRVLVLWPALAALDPVGRVRVLGHELTHAGLAATTSGRTPAWLVEGLALYASRDDRSAQAGLRLRAAGVPGIGATRGVRAPAALTLRGLARPDAMARQSGPAQGDAYAYASAAAFAIARRHGESALLRLHRVFNDPRIPGDPGPGLQRRAIRRVLGISAARLEAEVRAAALAAAPGG